jgi:hypothetical protein
LYIIFLKQNFMPNIFGMKKIVILLLISFPSIVFAQNVGIGTTAPVTKLNIAGGGSSPAIPGATSTALFRIGIGTAEGIDFGKMGSSPFSAWMQAGLNGAISDPLSLQPLGGNVGIGTISPAEKLDVTGNINLSGKVIRNATGTANLVPICYGTVNGTGAIFSGTGNFSVVKVSTGWYEITIAGEFYFYTNYTTILTVLPSPTNVPKIAIANSLGGNLTVRIYNLAGGVEDQPFSFVTYKN